MSGLNLGEQLSFDVFAETRLGEPPVDCRWPNHKATTGYKNGCRCARCRVASPRARSPLCRHPGCHNYRHPRQQYCDEHRPSNIKPPRIRSTGPCALCPNEHGWYESVLSTNVRPELHDLYRRVCPHCRRLYMGVIKTHRLDTGWAVRLITATTCELGGEHFPISKNGRYQKVVDHDHRCCSGPSSCGRCIRGIICTRCNVLVGAYELLRDSVGLDRVLAYAERVCR